MNTEVRTIISSESGRSSLITVTARRDGEKDAQLGQRVALLLDRCSAWHDIVPKGEEPDQRFFGVDVSDEARLCRDEQDVPDQHAAGEEHVAEVLTGVHRELKPPPERLADDEALVVACVACEN